MKKILFSANLNFLLILIFFGCAVSRTFAQSNNESPLPAPTGFVNDYVGVIDAATKQRLEQKLKDLKEKNNPPIELAVAVVDTTGDRQIFDYSLAVARGWGIGSKDLDNPSALLLIAVNDRKYFTQVSRDLEDELPDGLVGSLQRQFLVPEFKKANYGKGIEDTINAYINAIENRTSGTIVTTSPTPRERKTNSRGISSIPTGCFCLLIIGALILFSIIKSFFGGGRGGRGGGGSGLCDALPWIIGSAIVNSATSGSSWGSGSSDSGWSSGGGSDWGGFGGGGDFGGGGAGGDW
ncbi:MAG: TPM domain-containing protein [Pyrinomonadaceae bacterium]